MQRVKCDCGRVLEPSLSITQDGDSEPAFYVSTGCRKCARAWVWVAADLPSRVVGDVRHHVKWWECGKLAAASGMVKCNLVRVPVDEWESFLQPFVPTSAVNAWFTSPH